MSRWVPVAVTATSPLTATFPDGSSQRCLGIVGLTYATTGVYVASVQQGSIPIVFPVA
jgi:hypothetical protein